ncbi:MAG TPA: hypothetical protein VN203_02350, partial [Candidatus Acidoferrum sp.]|nr:hypothetical protein [Candidatus Acidoferrum sp.]
FSGTTLTGGAYNLTGTLQFNGANIVTNASSITLSGTSSQIINQSSANALASFATNNSGALFAINSGRTFTTAGSFTNNGTLTVGSSTSKFTVNGNLTNFSGTTLTGGAYNLTGVLQFNGANIVTNAASITLTGTSSQILNQSSANGLANFATNAAAGKFTVAGGRIFTTAGAFSNSGSLTLTGSGSKFTTGGTLTNTGTLSIGSGSTFTVGGTGAFTQTAGTTTDNGTLTLQSSGTLALNGGSLFGSGTISGAFKSSGTVSPGATTAATGILTETGAYTQNSGGILNIAIAGTTAGTQYDQLNPTTASLGGTLNISLGTGFTPSLGSTFKILNFSSKTGTFATVNGLSINGTEHFTITYQPTDVLLTVVTGAAIAANRGPVSRPSLVRYTLSARGAELLGFRLWGSSVPQPSASALARAAWGGSRNSGSEPLFGGRGLVKASGSLKVRGAVALGSGTGATLSGRQSGLSGMAALVPGRGVSVGRARPLVVSAAGNGAIPSSLNPVVGAPSANNGGMRGMMAPRSLEYQLDVLSIVRMGPRRAWRELWRQSDNPYVPALASFTCSGIR